MPNRRALRGLRISGLLLASSVIFTAPAQVPGSYQPGPAESLPFTQASGGAPALLPPDQLENLVAPVALYPDQLLSQVLAASTYPLEIVEAQQWLRQNGYLRGPRLVDAAKQQNWDPSVQALVIFPDALALLTRDVQWTTALGNAFLAQQADVMDAIQRLRARAQNNGRLRTTPQEIVTTQAQGGWNPIEIRPSDPRIVYVPTYNPQNVWGPPAQGYNPQTAGSSYGDPSYGYPSGYSSGSSSGSSFGQFFGAAVNLASYFTGFGGLATGGWGWALNWLTHSVLLNGSFLSLFGFHSGDSYGGGYSSGGGYGYGAPSVWVHNPAHRGGVPYSNREVAGRFGGGYRTRNVAFSSRSGFGSGSYGGGSFGGRYDGGSRGSLGGGWRTPAGDRIVSQPGWRSPTSASSFGNSSSSFGNSSRSFGNSSRSFGNSYRSFGNSYRAAGNRTAGYSPSSGWPSRNAPALRASNEHFSDARSPERFSAPRQSSQHFSAPHFSAAKVSQPHGSGGHSSHSSGGHGSKGHGSGGHSHKH